ncbi:MAG: ATPase [Elusimicrobia bacterium RIFOXYA1_FULL_47_7]|nr:MAG: ATPase [Elusimicrobia bacterium RIFOXYA12_FULL_49_49]OGS07137.1 MAG: ATPase [Elusimicrobia bacterium RIFOXYA1_FULL_47_7]OGS10559.1 MAG: ATPase [Elusimicrobia bacterium RIFOXYB1_FULL_48_9]OGS16387.1 MAG: ATPase [Elusimicrobia bacterium RIFOXYA2_FULL_47_53]OGS27236.1 MAG: ATPase [Elusimicrobia bacterium RIFOXYB12_FULL_50_12]OGS30436.1 MAG: ATPase [Elusimicrobia bacterium RIFOXYB2_FULL_46_23]
MDGNVDIKEINEQVKKESVFAIQLINEINKVIVGQSYIIERMLIGLLSNGHILLEGVPGLAKTLAVKTLSSAIKTKFQRIQFTPDLLPADLVGTLVYNPQSAAFSVKKGPIFSNLILADEINRAPAKVQSALLEAMQERQVTIGDETFKLPEPFLVLATQNPIEQEGTYPLPEAQVDRFMLKLKITYPKKEEEKLILERMTHGGEIKINPVVTPEEINRARETAARIYIDEKVKNYIVDIVFASREPENHKLEGLKNLIAYGASPRATINLTLAAKAYAFLQGRGFVTPEDVKIIGPDVLRHRIILTYEAEAEELTSDDIVKQIFDGVEVP